VGGEHLINHIGHQIQETVPEDSWKVRNSAHGRKVATPLHRPACACVCAFFAVIVQLRTHWLRGITVSTCARACAVCSRVDVGGQGWGGRGCIWEHLLLVVGVIFDRRSLRDRGVACAFCTFWCGWECMWVYVCLYARTHAHCTWGIRIWAQGSGQDNLGARRIEMD